METTLIAKLFTSFEEIKHLDEEGREYWSARDMQKLLTYKEWRNFEVVLEKAMEACRKAGNSKFDHFVGVNKMVSLGSEAEREVFDIHLTRYAAYLIAQNGDPRKSEIAFAQAHTSPSRHASRSSSRRNSSTSSVSTYERSSRRQRKSSQDLPSSEVSMIWGWLAYAVRVMRLSSGDIRPKR